MSEYTYVEKPFLDQLAALGWQIIDHGNGVPGDPTISHRTSFREVTLNCNVMAWVQRANGREYFYLSKRNPDGSVSSTYLGFGKRANIESGRLNNKELQRQTLRQEKQRIADPERETQDCSKQLAAVHKACLFVAGLHNPKGRGWRWGRDSIKQGQSDSESTVDVVNGKVSSDFSMKLELLLKLARKGERPAISRLRVVLNEQQGLLDNLMRAACRVQMRWIYLIAGEDLFQKEVLIQEIKKMKGSLSDEGNGTDLEKILVEQTVLLYLQLQYHLLREQQRPDTDLLMAQFRQRKTDSAAKAYLKSLEAMLTLNKLLQSRNCDRLGPLSTC